MNTGPILSGHTKMIPHAQLTTLSGFKESQTVGKKSDSGQMYKVNRSYYPFPYFMAPPN